MFLFNASFYITTDQKLRRTYHLQQTKEKCKLKILILVRTVTVNVMSCRPSKAEDSSPDPKTDRDQQLAQKLVL